MTKKQQHTPKRKYCLGQLAPPHRYAASYLNHVVPSTKPIDETCMLDSLPPMHHGTKKEHATTDACNPQLIVYLAHNMNIDEAFQDKRVRVAQKKGGHRCVMNTVSLYIHMRTGTH